MAFLLFCVPGFLASINQADQLPFSWGSVKVWVKSADCARKTHAFLAICPDGRLTPIADSAAGDDPGHALALGIYSALTGASVVDSDVSRVNTILNYTGLACLAALLFSMRLPLVSLLLLAVGPLIANQLQAIAPHPAQFGVACLSALLALAIVGLPLAGSLRRLFWWWIFAGFLGLMVAMLFREAIGLMGVLASILALGASYHFSIMKVRHSALIHIAIACATILSVWTPYSVLRIRDVAFDVGPSIRMEQHGAWHGLYIGLGAVDNPFGIQWDDNVGMAKVNEVNPSAGWLTPEYFSTLRRAYFEIVVQNPAAVARVYWKKLRVALDTYFTWIILVVLAIVFAGARISLRNRFPGLIVPDAIFAINGIFITSFLGQAVLFHPSPQYLFPIQIFLLLQSGVLLELLLTWRTATTPISRISPR